MTVHERCWLCAFHNGTRCTQTYRLVIHNEPTGGQIEFTTVPGMVPEEMKVRLEGYFKKLLDRIIPVIEMMPVWEEIRQYQMAHPEREACPGREVSKVKAHYLTVVT